MTGARQLGLCSLVRARSFDIVMLVRCSSSPCAGCNHVFKTGAACGAGYTHNHMEL